MRVYLADLGHNLLTFSSDTYPLGVANLATYLQAFLKVDEPLDVSIYREPQDLANMSRAIYGGMAQHDPQAVWVLQTWNFSYQRSFWTDLRIKAFLSAVSDNICFAIAKMLAPLWRLVLAYIDARFRSKKLRNIILANTPKRF